MRRSIVAGALVCLIAGSAQAASHQACYSPPDIEAEQAVRFQTQLMVLSDLCRDPSYTNFSQRVHDALSAYQRQLVDHFRRTGAGAAERALDTFMTRLANEFSLASGRQTLTEVCKGSAAQMIATANSLNSSADFRHYIAAQAVSSSASYR